VHSTPGFYFCLFCLAAFRIIHITHVIEKHLPAATCHWKFNLQLEGQNSWDKSRSSHWWNPWDVTWLFCCLYTHTHTALDLDFAKCRQVCRSRNAKRFNKSRNWVIVTHSSEDRMDLLSPISVTHGPLFLVLDSQCPCCSLCDALLLEASILQLSGS